MTQRGPARWNARYAAGHDLWRCGAHPAVTALVPGLLRSDGPEKEPRPAHRPRAVDLGAGDGRHAVWLARQGWQVDAVDYAEVGVALGQANSDAAGVEVAWQVADVTQWRPVGVVDLVLMSYFTLDQPDFERVVGWLRPGGHVLVIAHGEAGRVGRGPQDRRFRHTPQALRDRAFGLEVLLCENWATEQGEDVDASAGGDVVLFARVRPAAVDEPAPPP